MRRPTRYELDQAIIDHAAVLFARHGYSHTSIQQIADAVGYSKTGLLHRFPNKEALRQAVVEQFVTELTAIIAAVGGLPPGPERDLAAVRALTDLALRRRGSVALVVSALTVHEEAEGLAWLDGVAEKLFEAFAVTDAADLERHIRIVGALGGLGVISVTWTDDPGDDLRAALVAMAFDALGHRTPPS